VITNAAKYDVDEATLSTELQQLGLPKGSRRSPVLRSCPWTNLQLGLIEHCDSLSRAYRDNLEKLRTQLSSSVFQCKVLSFLVVCVNLPEIVG